MTDAERKALVERLRNDSDAHGGSSLHNGCVDCGLSANTCSQAADQIEADGQRIAELEAALRGLLGMWSTRTVDYARAALGDKHDQ